MEDGQRSATSLAAASAEVERLNGDVERLSVDGRRLSAVVSERTLELGTSEEAHAAFNVEVSRLRAELLASRAETEAAKAAAADTQEALQATRAELESMAEGARELVDEHKRTEAKRTEEQEAHAQMKGALERLRASHEEALSLPAALEDTFQGIRPGGRTHQPWATCESPCLPGPHVNPHAHHPSVICDPCLAGRMHALMAAHEEQRRVWMDERRHTINEAEAAERKHAASKATQQRRVTLTAQRLAETHAALKDELLRLRNYATSEVRMAHRRDSSPNPYPYLRGPHGPSARQ